MAYAQSKWENECPKAAGKTRGQGRPFFALSWTVAHPLSADSPLFGVTEAKLRDEEAEILVSLIGIDETVSQTIHARFSYTADDIAWGASFVDVLSRTPHGLIQVDLDHFHDLQK